MAAAKTALPVLGVPVESKALHGVDSLLSIVQMPAGVPVATLAIGRAGAVNAALLAASILGNKYPQDREAVRRRREGRTRRAGPSRPAGGAMTRVGVLGGGQLGRMLALAGLPLGLRFRFLEPAAESPAGQVAERVAGPFDDPERIWTVSRPAWTSSPTSSRTCRPTPPAGWPSASRSSRRRRRWRRARTASPRRRCSPG